MLQDSTAFEQLDGRRQTTAPEPGPATDMASKLVARLREFGARVELLRSSAGMTAGGADLQVWPRKIMQSDTAMEHLQQRVAALLHDDLPLTLSLKAVGTGDHGIQVLEEFCARLRSSLDENEALLSRIGLSLRSHQIPLQAYLLISRSLLGSGPRYVILDSLQMLHHGQPRVQEETDRNWTFLWQQRSAEASVTPVYGAAVRTGCPLLADEAAEAVLPQRGMLVPVGSAWLPIVLRLPEFAEGGGQIRWPDLQSALEACIDLGDQLLDILCWPTAGQRSDAWLNRRLCILLGGIGSLVQSAGMDPAGLGSLQWIDATISRIRKILWDRSHVVAARDGLLPALLRADPSAGLCDHSHRQNWRRRWRLALANSAVRHRNLLVMSPYSLLPEGGAAPAEFTDLMPVLTHADAYAFTGQPPLSVWTVGQFRKFHTRAWAVMQRRNARSLVAAGV
jgi:hypothetical protein